MWQRLEGGGGGWKGPGIAVDRSGNFRFLVRFLHLCCHSHDARPRCTIVSPWGEHLRHWHGAGQPGPVAVVQALNCVVKTCPLIDVFDHLWNGIQTPT